MKALILVFLVTIVLLMSLLACSNDSDNVNSSESVVIETPAPTLRTLPTLYPTRTTFPTPLPSATHPPEPTEVPSTPIDFEQIAVEVQYQIPSISLDRKIVGNVSNRIFLEDLTTGNSYELPDQPGILLELQQVFGRVVLEEMPVGCDTCVSVDFTLPLAGLAGSGWLTDTQLLASLENFTTVHLSPHFPPDTVIGLRKSATAYHVAESLAVTSDNRVWQWAATESQVREPTVSNLLPNLIEVIPERELLEDLYVPIVTECPSGPGIETLKISTSERPVSYRFSCPNLSLPSSIVPLYSMLDGLFDPTEASVEPTKPTPALEMNTVLKYVQSDGLDLTIFSGGRTILTTTENISLTAILTESLVISKTTELIESRGMQQGVAAFLTSETDALYIRGSVAVYSFAWNAEEDQTAAAIRGIVNNLIKVIESIVENENGIASGALPP